MNINKYLVLLSAVALLQSCGFGKYDIEHPSKKVLFTYQKYNRQVVVGEGLGIKVGFVFSGLPENDRDRFVRYKIDPSLVEGTERTMLPDDYYEFENVSQIIIPKGSLKAYMPVYLDSAKFVSDPKALTGEYVLPIRILEADADEIAGGKDYTMISISYQGKQYGNYTYKGKAIASDGTSLEYSSNPSVSNSIRQLQTVGTNVFRVYADQTGTNDPAKSQYSMLITVPVHGGGDVVIMPDTDYLQEIEVLPDGMSAYDEVSKTFILKYKFKDKNGVEWKCEDVMSFRNRVRDDQGDGRVLYEWRGF